MFKSNYIFALQAIIFFVACTTSKKSATGVSDDFIKNNFSNATTMLNNMLKTADEKFSVKNGAYPRTTNKEGKMATTSMYDWTPGFFPGNLWYTYEFTKDPSIKAEAVKWTEKLEPLQYYTGNHDLGFMVYCSYGNANRLAGKPEYKNILINAAKSLCSRYNATVGSIKSWNRFNSWHGNASYDFPVIIDNMMNLELLFFITKITGDNYYRNIAIKHAETTMQNQFRPDYSSYHVICYDSTTGKVVAKETAQGYADNSTWSRGQAWAIYGFTMTYRETKDPRFLKTAIGLADYFINNKNLPEDGVPYWDFNANEPGYTPGVKSYANKVTTKYRDASAAPITASGLLELSTYVGGKESEKYKNFAIKMIRSLAGPAYLAKPGTNGDFIIEHCVGSIPHQSEIDVPLVYADYYFLESLIRLNRLNKGQALIQ